MKTANEIQRIAEDELGTVVLFEQIALGVYEAATKLDEEAIGFPNDYYLVELDSPIISEKAKTYGKPLGDDTGIVLFDIDDETGGRFIIDYELALYRLKAGIQQDNESSVHELATFGREHHPEYFGEYPVPTVTPWGYIARHKKIENGIYWIETDVGQNVLSLSYPFWNCELTEAAKVYGKHTQDDIEKGIDNCLGNLFFLQADACIPIFELLLLRPQWMESGMIDRPALMNAIWELHSEYAISYNTTEQAGGHDALGVILNSLGVDVPLKSSLKEMMMITADAGTDYLKI